MSFNTMATFFALAALAANVATVALVVMGLTGRGRDRSPFEMLRGTILWLAGSVALAAMLGSLYLSEIAHLVPCRFCWFQRIAMYPLALILLMAAYRKDGMARLYAATLAVIGAGIAIYHRFLQAFPSLDSGSCAAVGPACTAALIEKFGFVTIPYMSMSGFLLILALLWADRVNAKTTTSEAVTTVGTEPST
ncbi:MAG: disulfide bond formation protein B [Acidimicrobiia bacterium]|nr:disulfide bond formation protein B [Acidimicrobiia bacterium]